MTNNRKKWEEEDYGDIFEPEEEQTAKDRIKQELTPRRIIVVASVLALVIIYVTVTRQFSSPGDIGPEVEVQIPAGTTTTGIAKILEANDVIPSDVAFRVWVRLKYNEPFQAGEYTFHRNSDAGQALEVLKSGPDLKADRLIVPEGFRLEQIAELVGRQPGFSAQKFREAATNGAIRSAFQPSNAPTLEGFLFPDTYLLSAADNETTLVQRMVNKFDSVARDVGLDQAPRAIQQSPFDALIIASMIEAEARVPQDRGKISQVIQNRIAQNMKLQIDATVLYAYNYDRQALATRDLNIQSPYNTYLNFGLPPGPISNPGRASMEAALEPEPGPWLFYVLADQNGAHAFGVTAADHERNVAAARAKGLLGG